MQHNTISHVVTNVVYDAELWEQLVDAFAPALVQRIAPDDLDGLRQALDKADVAVLQNLLPPDEIRGQNLRWVHLTHAGIDRVARPEMLKTGIRLSGSAGYSVEALAEHALLFMLSLAYRSADLWDSQRRSAWEKEGREHLRSLYGHTVGIVGLGHIGKALAVRCSAMGMRVVGYRRKSGPAPAGVDRIYSEQDGDQIDGLLNESDYVVLALPLTDASHNLMNARTLAMMKKSAYLINIARGGVVDEPALIAAIEGKQISGAGLDVFCQEPLPSDSPFWTLPNVLVTPHTSAREPDRDQRAITLLRDNIHRYQSGQKLLNEMGKEDIFSAPN